MGETSITFRLPEDLYDRAKAKAKREDITLSQVLRRYLRGWVSDHPAAVELDGGMPETR